MNPTGRRPGALIAIGGSEDRQGRLDVLRQTLHAAMPPDDGPARVAVLTAASTEPDAQWQTYRDVFQSLGAEVSWLHLRDRAAADAPATLERLDTLDLVFMTGGDQERLMRVLGGSATHRLMISRQRESGLAIAGTSAGASALATLMPGGSAEEDGGTPLDFSDAPLPHGLGFIRGVVIDQHFSQRRRLARLINLASRQGGLAGLGLDEDTAAIFRPGPSMRVVGSGSATLVDCRSAQRSRTDPPVLSLSDLRLHRVCAGGTLAPQTLADNASTPGGGLDFAALLP